ncbi:hypothetical protein ACFYVR_10320 [Rhodococcus sp. NPDC003318]|uniref:hypothetical protein n=1 Tax=Rhodococcus sp. NPDC003318 TaxID=3364503 RepID=UPI0036B2271A
MLGSIEDVAFGPCPGAAALPPVDDDRGRWLRAVALGGQGRYAAAHAELATLRRGCADAVLESLAASTEASLLRQLGWHRLASGQDGRALAVLGGVRSPEATAARADALTGLAADALGCGRLRLAFRLLDRCDEVLDASKGSESDAGRSGGSLWRQRIRLYWVTAETRLASGDGAGGRAAAARAVELASASPSVRHRVKSELLHAAAISAGSEPAAAVASARAVLSQCEEHHLVPLQWAAAMLLGGVEPGSEADSVRRRCEERIAAAGGRFRET